MDGGQQVAAPQRPPLPIGGPLEPHLPACPPLRLQVHPKLVNFMTPVELDAPQFAAQLFSNLFGGGGQAARK